MIVQEAVQFEKLIRVIIIGEEPICAVYDTPDKELRASVCLNESVKRYGLDPELVELSMKVKDTTKSDITFIDFFKTKQKDYVFNEVNRKCALSHVERACKLNLTKKIVDFLVEKAKR